jgi:ankyrin repeat protein
LVYGGMAKITELFIENGKVDFSQQTPSGCENFNIVYHAENVQLLKWIIKNKYIDFTKGNDKGHTYLHMACIESKAKVVKALLEDDRAEQFVNKKNNYGSTPIKLACNKRNGEIVKILIQDNRVEISNDDKVAIRKFLSTPLDDHPIISKINEQSILKKDLLDMFHFFSANGKLNAVKWISTTLKIPSISDDQLIEISPIITNAWQEYSKTFLEAQIAGAINPQAGLEDL